jgi:hypothetical protein
MKKHYGPDGEVTGISKSMQGCLAAICCLSL